jgi:tRNA pseudouridine55 synthase
MSYWLNINKPKGISSAKAVAIVKKALCGKKIGHCGTLDLEAEGVLPLAIGEATKLVRMLVDAKKQYIFTIQFGAKTDTADFSGKILEISDYIPSKTEIFEVCQKFIGTISQVPPAFSAIKVAGVRSYSLARQNNSVILPARNIEIYHLECLGFDQEKKWATYLVECSKGTYIRTLAEDIALSLQSLGFVVELRRTQVGLFKLQDAIEITGFEGVPQETVRRFLEGKSTKIEAVLDDIPVLDATLEQAKKIKQGQKSFFEVDNKNIDSVWIRYQGILLAIGSLSENCFNSSRVFNLI